MNWRNIKLLEHSTFVLLCNTIDNKMKQLSKDRIIRQKNQAQPISLEQEDHMWRSGILGNDTPEKLVNTLLYLVSVHFALHVCDEHKALKVGAFSQLKIKVNPKTNLWFLEYNKHRAKNHQGGIKSLHYKNKIVKAFENVDNPEHCIVRIFEKYMSKCLSMDPKCSFDLYLHPLAKITSPNVWYSCQAIGIQTLQKFIMKLMHNAGIPGRHTNHSLRATAATRLYDQNVDEHRIAKLTGHHSVAVHYYQCISVEKEKELSDVLYGKSKKTTKRNPTATVTSPQDPNFNIGTLMQFAQPKEKWVKNDIICVQKLDMEIKDPVEKTPDKTIVVQPIVNLNAKDL